jgi:phage anti-repressor protein
MQVQYAQVKKLELNDPFIMQAYGAWKAMGASTFEFNNWMNMVLEKDYEQAAHLISVIKSKTGEKYNALVDSTSLYLYWKLGLNQTFFNKWLEISSETNFLKTPLGIGLDQVISVNSSTWFLDNSIQIDPNHKIQLEKIKNSDSKFVLSAQAWNAMRSGDNAIQVDSETGQ